MKKLIAQRLIQYLGHSYERGAALPANDLLMTEAWLKAGSAAWEEFPGGNLLPGPDETRRREAERQAAEVLAAYGVAIADEAGNFIGKEELAKQLISVPAAETQTAGALRALDVEFMDEEGRFVGEERLKEQLCNLVQELLPGYEDVFPAVGCPEGGRCRRKRPNSGPPPEPSEAVPVGRGRRNAAGGVLAARRKRSIAKFLLTRWRRWPPLMRRRFWRLESLISRRRAYRLRPRYDHL